MPSTKDFNNAPTSKYLIVGESGVGKSTLLGTLPGKTFLYAFDPNCIPSLREFDIDYEYFEPDNVPLDAIVLANKPATPVRRISKTEEPKAYANWETHFESSVESGFFDSYDSIALDSMTMFQEIILDRVKYLNGRPGKWPEQADWTAMINTVSNVFRVLTTLDKNLFVTAHVSQEKDELSGRIYNHLHMSERLRKRIPMLFDNVWAIEAKNSKREAILRANRDYPYLRTSFRNAKDMYDVTIKDFSKPHNYGIGHILAEVEKAA